MKKKKQQKKNHVNIDGNDSKLDDYKEKKHI